MRAIGTSRRLRDILVLTALLAVGCSTPTSPTPPGSTPPPSNPNTPTALAVSCPAAQNASSTTGAPVPVTYPAPTTTGGVAPVQVSCTPASGTAFAVGTTVVQCAATDAAQERRTCSFPVTVAGPAPRLSRTRFLAFGDSMTAGEVVTSSTPGPGASSLAVIPALSYPTRLATLLRARYTAQTIEVTNAGQPGEWAEEGARRLPSVMSSGRPDVLLLLHGSNELAALGTNGVNRAWAAIDTMAKEGRNRGARVFLAALPPPRPGLPKALPVTLIQSLNDRIRTTARGEGAVFVDLFTGLNTDLPRYISSDGLHPTEAGYLRMAELFFDAIRADLEVR